MQRYCILMILKIALVKDQGYKKENYSCSPAKRIVVVLISKCVVMMTPDCSGQIARGTKYRDVSLPAPNNAASTLSKRTDLEMIPKSVAE